MKREDETVPINQENRSRMKQNVWILKWFRREDK